jgi:hypothetical protein
MVAIDLVKFQLVDEFINISIAEARCNNFAELAVSPQMRGREMSSRRS